MEPFGSQDCWDVLPSCHIVQTLVYVIGNDRIYNLLVSSPKNTELQSPNHDKAAASYELRPIFLVSPRDLYPAHRL